MRRLIVISIVLVIVSVSGANLLISNGFDSGSSAVGDVEMGLANVSTFPEPATICLLTLGGLVLRKRRV